MTDVNKSEDILAVAEGLSEDLSNISASAIGEASEEVEVTSEEEKTEESTSAEEEQKELSEGDAEADPEEEKNSSDDSEKADVQDADSENAEKPEESLSKGDEDQETPEEENNLSDNKEGVEQDINLLKASIKSLEEENAKLKSALHRTLVERVVDTKIGLGFESADERENLIGEHASRTAASLADSLRDLAKAPAKANKRISDYMTMPQVTSEAEVSSEENVLTLDKEENAKTSTDPNESFEQVLVDALMGRRKL